MRRTFLETGNLLVDRINTLALAEGNAKSPIYRMHKWWARRLGSVFRMIILSAFMDGNHDPKDVWTKYALGTNLDGKIVLDPFMGGGTTIVEALRLGAKVIGIDINPVAWFITKKEVEAVDLSKVELAFEQLEATAGNRIRQLYQTSCPRGHRADVMYFFWVKEANCLSCNNTVDLFPNYELSRGNHEHVSVCPRCFQIVNTEGSQAPKTATCPECRYTFDPRSGPAGRGQFECPVCGATNKILEVIKRQGAPLATRLHALEGLCKHCGRFFKRIDDEDLARWENAKVSFLERKGALLIPDQCIPVEGRSDPRPVNHGYTHFYELFNERQLLSLSILLEEIMRIPDANVRELLLVAFSDCLDSNNMFCKYEVAWHKISLLFGLHAYHPIERPTENNVWGTDFGRGTFVKCYEKMLRGKNYGKRPYQRLSTEKRQTSHLANPRELAEGVLVRTVDEMLTTERSALLKCQSSTDLAFIPDKSVDAIITDPPYFDNVQYSELADFFYVWLRLALKKDYSCFEDEHSYRQEEIVKNDNKGKTTSLFNKGLGKVFEECHRVLKDESVLVFSFHHNQLWAWSGIAELLLNSGFYISAAPVTRSEGKSGFHSSSGNIRYDCILVCRKQPSGCADSSVDEVELNALRDALYWVRETMKSGMAVTKVDAFTILMGQAICRYTRSASRCNLPPLDTFLARINELLDRFTLSEELCEQPEEPLFYRPEVRQLALFIAESQERYST